MALLIPLDSESGFDAEMRAAHASTYVDIADHGDDERGLTAPTGPAEEAFQLVGSLTVEHVRLQGGTHAVAGLHAQPAHVHTVLVPGQLCRYP